MDPQRRPESLVPKACRPSAELRIVWRTGSQAEPEQHLPGCWVDYVACPQSLRHFLGQSSCVTCEPVVLVASSASSPHTFFAHAGTPGFRARGGSHTHQSGRSFGEDKGEREMRLCEVEGSNPQTLPLSAPFLCVHFMWCNAIDI